MSTVDTTNPVKFVRQGTTFVLQIDPELLRELGIDESTPVSVSTDGRSIRISLKISHTTQEQLAATMERVNARWSAVLKKLAE